VSLYLSVPTAILVGMTAVAWGVVVALIVGVGNLALAGFTLRLSRENRQHAREEPIRQRQAVLEAKQRELHEQLRMILENVGQELTDLRDTLRSGDDVPEWPTPGIARADNELARIARRLTDTHALAGICVTRADAARLVAYWLGASGVQRGTYVVSVETATTGVGPEVSKRDRQVQAAHTELRDAVMTATVQVNKDIAYLDGLDRGETS